MNWEYKDYPQHSTILTTQTIELLKKLWDGSLDVRSSIISTKAIHHHLFKDLTPNGHEYFAGHYRGENFALLQNYHVSVSGNPNVGCPPKLVQQIMSEFSMTVEKGIDCLDAFHQTPSSLLEQRLRKTLTFACAAFVKLNQIHPYANGNGHIARFMLIAALKRYGYEVRSWTLDPRPADPPYTPLIREYENGNKEPLLFWIMQLLELH